MDNNSTIVRTRIEMIKWKYDIDVTARNISNNKPQ